ncbi:MAG: nuclear transport factor 2 family protein [Microbacterium sp.]|uniref:nuclear transport factor 2 family protein n=1 Tax=Microbacterium sp. TaxID=51671 RepID=UPI002605ADA4|nr:nuclear transport factor 2 family protein [Microbacterium sp.]MCX6501494.1 nuclear transport factor 2 family protein [Microbacterium sp.]
MTTNADIIRAHYAASDAGDLEGMLAPLAPDVQWREADGFPAAGLYIGPEAVKQNVFLRLAGEYDDYRLTVDEVLDAGDAVVGVGTYTGTFTATGKAFRARVAHLWRLQDGVVTHFEQITDTLPVDQARH